jgi:hypothetical protein
MTNSRIDAIALFAAMIAAGLSLTLLTSPLTWLSSIAGIVLLLTIFAYDRDGQRSGFQSLAFSSVCAFCLVLVAAAGLRFWAAQHELSGPSAGQPVERFLAQWLPITWTCAGRTEVETKETPSAPQPAATAGSVVQAEATVVPQSPQQAGIPVRPGKEVMVYVGLVGEGLNVMRSVKAEHIGRNYYRIVESMPEGETWEYGPGQIVRCEKKKLSSGKALVAVEEAPRKV